MKEHANIGTDQIIAELQRCADTQFAPVVVQAFIEIAERNTNNLIVNSARTVTRQHVESTQVTQPLNMKRLAEIYGMTPV